MGTFNRKHKEDRPVVALCYDFDKTLTRTDMQAQGFIQSLGYEVKTFWDETNGLSAENDMDNNLAYMYEMMSKSVGKVLFTKRTLLEYGAQIELYKGVGSWFRRIREYGEKRGVIVEHYIISSGLKEMIEGTSIADEFEMIYASAFYFDERGAAMWPAQAINYTNKTQCLFRISKGTLEMNDPAVNDRFPPEELRVPFANMIYIGDSATDIPCMKLVTSYGGSAIGVYDPETGQKASVYQMVHDGRIRYFAPADYSEGSRLEELVEAMIDKAAVSERLDKLYFENKQEASEYYRSIGEQQRRRSELIFLLENSASYSSTHAAVAKLSALTGWTAEDKQRLFKAAEANDQVGLILTDSDIAAFYRGLLDKDTEATEEARFAADKLGIKI